MKATEEPVVAAGAAVPVRAALTFAIVALSAPNAWIIERIDATCALVKLAADAIGASASIDVAIASPATIAATFDFEVIVITIINEFKCT